MSWLHMQFILEMEKTWDTELVDTMIKDGLWDAFHGYHMGTTAENVAENFKLPEMSRMVLWDLKKSTKLQKKKFKNEIINFKIKLKKAEINFNKDEHPRIIYKFRGSKKIKTSI